MTDKKAKPKKESKLIKMKKDDKKADVHPDEVKNYELGGYKKA